MKSKISHQLILAVAVISLGIFGLLSHFLIGSHHRSMINLLEQHANQYTETIKSATRYAMLHDRRDDVHRIIDSIGEQEGILRVCIFNKEGKIIYSPDRASQGTMVDKRAEACYGCHTADQPLERLSIPNRTRVFTDDADQSILGIINPIYNEPTCAQADCHAHPESQTVLGVLDVNISLEALQQHLARDRRQALIVTALAILATSTIIWLLFHNLVGKPVTRLLAATEAVADGDLSYQVEVKRNDEMGRLESSFNQMTARLAETQSQLYQSNKLASVGRLAAGIAHEINNPLTGVLTYSSLMLQGAGDDQELRGDLETIVHETKRCREIVRGLLDFARQVPPRKAFMDLNEIVQRALDIVDHQLGVHNIRLTRTLADDLPQVRVDPNQIQQVLINLLVNAADAIGVKGGEIFISTALKRIGGEPTLELKVADDGCGIPATELDKIFEPFYTTKESGGTGLGLAVAWGIINEHGGTISVSSQPDRGTAFTVHLPLNQRPKSVETQSSTDE